MDVLESLYRQWFQHPDWWFHADAVTDQFISDCFWGLMDTIALTDVTAEANNKIQYIARILLYDQIPRHVLRGQVADHVIAYYLQKALEIVGACFETLDMDVDVTDLELCFVLLPFRHTGVPHLCWKAADIVWKRLRKEDGHRPAHLIRFLKATYQRCPLNDQGDYLMRVHGPAEAAGGHWDFTPFDSILEYAPVELSIIIQEKRTLPSNHPCWMAMRQFVREHLAHDTNTKRVVVSVSGGVDSMVLLALLIEMRKMLGLGFKIVAFHVNYSNRGAESLLEEDFVRSWCCHRLEWFSGDDDNRDRNADAVYVRRISEIQRDSCMAHGLRSTYETYTRDVRYACYRSLCRLDDGVGGETGTGKQGMVLLGHNQDDCFENILTNLCAQEKYKNLKGMQETSCVAEILFGRPFLGVTKAEIYGAARLLGIPYVQDSTPAWSQRGRIRDRVRPVLNEWNPGMLDGLFALSDMLRGFYVIFEGQLQYCLEHTQWQDRSDEHGGHCTLLIPSHMHALLIQPLFWRAYLKELVGIVPSMKSLHACLPKLESHYAFTCAVTTVPLVLCKELDIRVHKHGIGSDQGFGKGSVRQDQEMEPSIRWTLEIYVLAKTASKKQTV